MSEPAKATIYIDVDDEITGIIDRVRSSDKKIVALVLPKRATVLQSIVNMKLLKRTADRDKKNLVLITSEAGLMPLAGVVGLHVAKNLQSKPEIPDGPPDSDIPESLVHEEEIESEADTDKNVDKAKTVGELAGVAAVASSAEAAADEAPIDAEEAAAPVAEKVKKAKKSKDKNLKVPNFERFRKWFILGGIALVLLVILGYLSFWVWPKATITIDADSSNLNTTISFAADTTTKTVNVPQNIVPAELKQSQKTGSQSVATTGQREAGNKATGTITIKNCEDSDPRQLPAGTIFTSTGTNSGISFSSNSSVTVPGGSFKSGGVICISAPVNINVTAVNNGTSSNISSTNYASSSLTGKFNITGSDMSGGTSNIVKTVTQADINGAQAQLATVTDPNAQATLTQQLEADHMYVIKNSFTTTGPTYTPSANVGDQAANVTVNSVLTYSLVGVSQDGLKQIIDAAATAQIDASKQAVLDEGLNKASFTVQAPTTPKPQITVQTAAVIGPKLNLAQIKQQVAGKKRAETTSVIDTLPSIKNVTVKYSPFWVSKTPTKTTKITIVFKQAAK